MTAHTTSKIHKGPSTGSNGNTYRIVTVWALPPSELMRGESQLMGYEVQQWSRYAKKWFGCGLFNKQIAEQAYNDYLQLGPSVI